MGMITPKTNSSLIAEIFSEIFRKKDYHLKLWISQAKFQLELKTRGRIARFTSGEDVVLEIISRVLSGIITWDTERVPNVNTFMYHQIRSNVSNLVKKELCKIAQLTGQDAVPDSCMQLDAGHYSIAEPGDVYKAADLNELKQSILKELGDDITASRVFIEMTEGVTNLSAAQSLGLTVREVENAKKRIKRAVQRIMKKQR